MSTLINVIIPCYNVEKAVGRCINSIKRQSYTDFNAIFVDDGSTDQTGNIIRKMIKDDERFHYVYKENGGQASARNNGLELCNSEYVTFVDSDDYLDTDYLSELYQLAKENNSDISCCYFVREYTDKSSLNAFSEDDMFLCKYPAVWGKLFKTELIKDTLFPVGLWYEDLCFTAQIMQKAKKISIVQKSLYHYVQNAGSTMYTYSDKIYDIYEVFDRIKEHKDSDPYRIEYMEVYHILVGTVFRASFKKGFKKKELKDIVDHVEKEYPYWYKNPYIKTQMSTFYRIYLWFIHIHWYGFVTAVLRLLNKHVSL